MGERAAAANTETDKQLHHPSTKFCFPCHDQMVLLC